MTNPEKPRISLSKINRLPAVIALDLDGTLLRSDGTVSPRTMAAIHRCVAEGMRPIIATARPPRSVRRMLPCDFPVAPWICYTGAEVYQDSERIIQHAIPPETAKEIIRVILAEIPSAIISAEVEDVLLANHPLNGPWLHIVVDLFQAIKKPVAKVIFDYTDIQSARAIQAALPTGYQLLTFKDIYNERLLADIMIAGISKASALKEYLERFDLTMDDVIAFGDDLIDLEMIQESGIGVAMGNAVPAVKEVADYVTVSHDEDGIAVALELLQGFGARD